MAFPDAIDPAVLDIQMLSRQHTEICGLQIMKTWFQFISKNFRVEKMQGINAGIHLMHYQDNILTTELLSSKLSIVAISYFNCSNSSLDPNPTPNPN